MGSLSVAVLMGGPSGEHDISLKSGQGVAEALARGGHEVRPVVVPRRCGIDEACAFVAQELTAEAPDVVFIALHGAFGEDGTVQQACETLRLPYTGSGPSASRLGMDKVAARAVFAGAGLAIPRGRVVRGTSAAVALQQEPLPVVVKPAREGSSLGITIGRAPEQWPEALAAAGRHGPEILIEAYVEGREITVGMLGEEPLPVVEIRPTREFFDYTAKYTAGLTEYLVPAPIAPREAEAAQAAAVRAHRALGCRHLSRADFILRPDDVPVLLEVNTVPGFTPTSLLPKAAACAGLSYDALCETLVAMAWRDSPHAAHAVHV